MILIFFKYVALNFLSKVIIFFSFLNLKDFNVPYIGGPNLFELINRLLLWILSVDILFYTSCLVMDLIAIVLEIYINRTKFKYKGIIIFLISFLNIALVIFFYKRLLIASTF